METPSPPKSLGRPWGNREVERVKPPCLSSRSCRELKPGASRTVKRLGPRASPDGILGKISNHICSLNPASQPQMAAGTECPTHQPPASPSQSMATQSFPCVRPQTFRSPPAPLFSLMLYSQPVSNCDWPCFQIHDGTTSHHRPLLCPALRLPPPAWISVAMP